jgi:hypothetical protein
VADIIDGIMREADAVLRGWGPTPKSSVS